MFLSTSVATYFYWVQEQWHESKVFAKIEAGAFESFENQIKFTVQDKAVLPEGYEWEEEGREFTHKGMFYDIISIKKIETGWLITAASGGMDYVRYRNIGGKEYEVEYNILFTSGGTAGSGDYLFTLPGGLQFDFTAPGQIAYTGVSGYNAMKYRLSSAFGDLIVSGFHSSSEAIPYNATQFRIMNNNWGTNTWLMHGPSNYAMSDGTYGMKMTFKFKAL